MLKRFLLFCVSLTGVLLLVTVGIIAAQDLLIFPGIKPFNRDRSARLANELPPGVTSELISTADGEKIERWRAAPSNDVKRSPYVALLVHGNGDTVESFYYISEWFQSRGVVAYSFDYRGFGKSSGWPSEEGIYQDVEAVWRSILRDEGIPSERVILLGQSLGTGPASYLAYRNAPGALVLLSPYTDLPSVVDGMEFYHYLSPFVWYEFPVARYIEKLRSTCVIIAHGDKDTTIPVSHSKSLISSYKGTRPLTPILSEKAGHMNIFGYTKTAIGEALDSCFKAEE